MPLFSRPDGKPADIAPYRRIMPFIMRTRNESAVYFSQQLDLGRTLPFIEQWNASGKRRITLFHLFTFAVVRVLAQRPRLNRFVAGSTVYDRDGIWVSYSAKKALNDDSPIVVLKRRLDGEATFEAMLDAMAVDLAEGRSDRKSHVDKELGVFLALPGPLLRMFVALQFQLYNWNLLPQAFTKPDPLYASVFIANLGSLKMRAAYHHLYEYGNIPIFATLGCIEKVAAVDDSGNVVPRTVAEVRWTLDERIEDGLYCAQSLDIVRRVVEDPATHVGQPAVTAPSA